MNRGMQHGLEGQKVRVVADLTLPEALVIWSLRKYDHARRGEDGRDSYGGDDPTNPVRLNPTQPDLCQLGLNIGKLDYLSATFTKVFGDAHLAEALETFGRLMTALGQGARCQLRINAYDEECLSIHEEHFLSILSAFQQTEIERAAMLVQWLINADFNPTFTRHARLFAMLLLKSGHSMTGMVVEMLQGETSLFEKSRKACTPLVERVQDLTLGEAVILQGTRRWVGCLHQEKDPFPVLEAHFGHYGVSGCAAGLNAVLRNIAYAASRMVDVRGPACPNLSPDEADLLHAVAGFQRSDSAPAHHALANWLPPAAIRLSAGALSSLAESLRTAGLILPLRKRSPGSEVMSHHTRSWHFERSDATGRTLH
ncbi:hypothetical protein [Denitrobaculum tricleocarpae]|uniref:Uncharacterized protein n=1 Tax=Denitrobaculum tricleocarpae TaxID=2591009 RepID=A0A545TEV7_9PROT|nr:hypothetical protein [Denitrobaculum tricleocarpae]TQV75759.1 hypothetical protein FKG95_22875 [Denitrobaculum tricleocarpae]